MSIRVTVWHEFRHEKKNPEVAAIIRRAFTKRLRHICVFHPMCSCELLCLMNRSTG